jgi:hypothetical protein
MLQNNTKYLAKKPSKSFVNRPTIMKNDKKHFKSMKKLRWNDVDAAARIWGGGRSASDPSSRLLGSSFGPEIPENREKHQRKKTT